MKNKKESLILGDILTKLAPKIGAKVILEPKWKIVGQITFKNGKRSYFRYNTLDLNKVGSSEIAKDKDYANFFMKNMGYRIIFKSKTFFRKDWAEAMKSKQDIDAAYKYALGIGFPVVVKPNSGSQGSGVSLVYNKREFYFSINKIFKKDRVALVQKYILGKDYRLVILDKQLISAYERIPLNVVGDGVLTIFQLLKKKQKEFKILGRDTKLDFSDIRILNKLKHQKLKFNSILKKGERIFLLDNANLSTGGDSLEVTNIVHPFWKKLAISLTKDMGLRLCGVDLIIKGSIENKSINYYILEVNAAPGLDHYAKMGKEQEKIVENLYFKVLKHLQY